MQDIKVTRYVGSKTWAGAIEPADRSWIAFVDLEGKPTFYLNRAPVTGAVVSDDPVRREQEIADLRARDAGTEHRRPGESPFVTEGRLRPPQGPPSPSPRRPLPRQAHDQPTPWAYVDRGPVVC